MIDTKDITLAKAIEAVEQRDKALADMKENLDIAVKALGEIELIRLDINGVDNENWFNIADEMKETAQEALAKIKGDK